ncbi:glycoprotein 3-alpha-L-fucosyltransferase A-like [Mizuhopecten yessoensis]|uniref:Fucosyltransferase n=1 Tax=Mizuhopecten yessoensis TaxID=6573 RepID=A0A210PSV8_MIZYE|nr:glycoprotein 3-alpha-L-fucosyltransferase A-like [Mizuhopecten yessoensis]XP_021376080.1 glycoprotein 3-alpha-L-fucosyltransferase A-like [Mizuhopecten yessoensis]XP_021376081.1 glycoprotein 3-alpha-L-fucosyltransferase A-like [Mizuhopecten yessoensis]OWF39536.1 Glycoprotein 3-alpha-L-fucosyltransferase A [Mizuhopecten yessoensis]
MINVLQALGGKRIDMTFISDNCGALSSFKLSPIPRRYCITAFGVLCFFYIGTYVILRGNSLTTMKLFNQNVCLTPNCDDNIIKFNQTHFVNKTTKKVLMWTKFFLGGWTDDIAMFMNKSKYSCVVTTDRNELESADALMFHYLDLYVWETVPGYRRPDQVWIMYNAEAPPHLHYTGLPWLNAFNWTMTYRTDSTVHGPYGAFVPLTPEEKIKASEMYRGIDYTIGKTKMVVAVISDCPDDAQRYRHMRELQKYVDIDFFGKCGNLTCPRTNNPVCNSMVYKFRIAFENANCKDYVTEKFWHSFSRNTVPIVNWKGDQVISAPPKSYINIHDFNSAQELSDYLNLLNANDTLYNEYFSWRLNYKVFGINMWYHFENLCAALHTPREAQTIIDPDKWIRTDSCNKWSITGVLQRKWDRFLFDWGW